MGVLEVEEIAEDEAVDVVFASKGAGRLRVWWSPDDEVGLDEGVAWWGCAIGTEGAMRSLCTWRDWRDSSWVWLGCASLED